jgi:signal recognition particle receptor subunit beta
MAKFSRNASEVNARIVYWGIQEAGKSTSIRAACERLRADHRGRLRQMPTGIDPTVTYDLLPIELGAVGGVSTRIQVVGVPGAPEHAPTRKQLLDEVDGIVFVVDSQPDRLEENLESLEELRGVLADYGRDISQIPLVVQYNKRDLADPFVLDELHRRFDVPGAAAFESVATEGRAVLQVLTTVSKQVIRQLREPKPSDGATSDRDATPAATAEATETPEAAGTAVRVEPPAAAMPAHQPDAADPDEARKAAGSLSLLSAGQPEILDERRLRLPLVLCDDRGREVRLSLTLALGSPDDESEP